MNQCMRAKKICKFCRCACALLYYVPGPRLLNVWAPITLEVALELLDYHFADDKVRSLAVHRLEKLTNEELMLFLLQLTQVLLRSSLSPSSEKLLNIFVHAQLSGWPRCCYVANQSVHMHRRITQILDSSGLNFSKWDKKNRTCQQLVLS